MPEYPHVRVKELPDAPNPTAHKKEVDEALGIEAFGFNVYTARPGERLPWGYHSHTDHEELVYVIEGRLAVETPATRNGDESEDTADRTDESRDGILCVRAGEALFVPPGAPQCARAVGKKPAQVIAIGAPKSTDDAVIAEYCPACEATTDRTHEAIETDDEPVYVLSCAECGTETDRFGAGPD